MRPEVARTSELDCRQVEYEVATGVSRLVTDDDDGCSSGVSTTLAAYRDVAGATLLDHRNTDAMSGQTVVASANILYTLPRRDAATTLTQVLER